MKFDVLIIGGGLAGLTCGIRLQKNGVKCAIVSTGQSALHFSSGSFDLLNGLPDGTKVDNPMAAVGKVSANHPYAKLGSEFAYYVHEAKQQFLDLGIEVAGDAEQNHLRITPMGTLKPTWLTFSDFTPFSSASDMAGKKIRVVNIAGFLDFNTKFVADSFEKYGAKCQISSINLPELERLRISPTEMRSTNIARVLENEKTLEALIMELAGTVSGFDVVALPAVFGLSSVAPVRRLKEALNIPVWLIPTMPPSVPGIRAQQQLRRSFEELGGVYMLGDTVVKADFKGNKVQSVYSVNHGDISFVAENFVLASGSYFSNGLIAQPDKVIEPVFGSDVDFTPGRDSWYDKSFFNKQNYMTFGVATDEKLRIKIKGDVQQNLFAVGSVLGGSNTIHEGCGAGVSMLTALYVADNLING